MRRPTAEDAHQPRYFLAPVSLSLRLPRRVALRGHRRARSKRGTSGCTGGQLSQHDVNKSSVGHPLEPVPRHWLVQVVLLPLRRVEFQRDHRPPTRKADMTHALHEATRMPWRKQVDTDRHQLGLGLLQHLLCGLQGKPVNKARAGTDSVPATREIGRVACRRHPHKVRPHTTEKL